MSWWKIDSDEFNANFFGNFHEVYDNFRHLLLLRPLPEFFLFSQTTTQIPQKKKNTSQTNIK